VIRLFLSVLFIFFWRIHSRIAIVDSISLVLAICLLSWIKAFLFFRAKVTEFYWRQVWPGLRLIQSGINWRPDTAHGGIHPLFISLSSFFDKLIDPKPVDIVAHITRQIYFLAFQRWSLKRWSFHRCSVIWLAHNRTSSQLFFRFFERFSLWRLRSLLFRFWRFAPIFTLITSYRWTSSFGASHV